MKIKIHWKSGNIQTLTSVPEDSEVIKSIRNNKIFDKRFIFENKNKLTCLNFTHAEQVELSDEIN